MAEMTLEEALAAADVSGSTDGVITIHADTRTMIVPESETLFGVLQDKDVERKYFKCPRIVGDNIDLSQHRIYVKYIQAVDSTGENFEDTTSGVYLCDDVENKGEYITFSWLLSANVFTKKGFIAFSVLASDGETTRWNTYPAVGTVLTSVPGGLEEQAENNSDIITQLLNRMEKSESTVDGMDAKVNTAATAANSAATAANTAANSANSAATTANNAASEASAAATACEGIVNGLNTMVDTVTNKSCVLSIEDGILTIREA